MTGSATSGSGIGQVSTLTSSRPNRVLEAPSTEFKMRRIKNEDLVSKFTNVSMVYVYRKFAKISAVIVGKRQKHG